MQPVSQTLVESIRAPIEQVFALLTDPGRMAQWLPGCDAVQNSGPLAVGARFTAHFGARLTEFEVVDCTPPRTYAWAARSARKGWRTTYVLEAGAGGRAATVERGGSPASCAARDARPTSRVCRKSTPPS